MSCYDSIADYCHEQSAAESNQFVASFALGTSVEQDGAV
jgi:hypothetical protein